MPDPIENIGVQPDAHPVRHPQIFTPPASKALTCQCGKPKAYLDPVCPLCQAHAAWIASDPNQDLVLDQPTRIDQILAERRKQYGDRGINQDGIGRIWQGILMHAFQMGFPPIPGHVVALMLAAMKTARAAVPGVYTQDNYDDIVGYQRIAEQLAPKIFDKKEKGELNGNVSNPTNQSNSDQLDKGSSRNDLHGVATEPYRGTC